MNVLLVGCKGQLGTTLAQSVPQGLSAVCLDLPELDITDPGAVADLAAREKPDVIVNASAYTAVDRSEDEADLAYRVNAAGPEHLAVAARRNGCRLVHISTDYVFDGKAYTPYPPDAVCSPLGVYGKSKRQGEIHIEKVTDDFLIIRTSWLYSQFGNNFVLTMLRLMNERDEVRVVADQVGSPTWAFTLATAIWAAVAKRELKGYYHWSDAGVTSWYDFAVAIQEEGIATGLLHRKVPVHPITTAEYPAKAKRPPYSVLSCRDAWTDFGVEPVQWRVALRRMLKEKANAEKNQCC